MSGNGRKAVALVDPPGVEQRLLLEGKRLAEAPGTRQPYGILAVDDDETVRRILSMSLRQQGFAVWLAADGLEAIELFKRHHDAIDVVLLDMRMPLLDGPHTLAALQQLDPEVRCCFMSGDPGCYSGAELRTLGAVAVLPKPFRLDDVAYLLWDLASRVREDRPTCELAPSSHVNETPSRR